jgi:2-beta-glucuronyltransferase
MASAVPEVTFHIFGAGWTGELPANVMVHGERDFATIVPYIVHASFGIAPYRLTESEVYLAESSLKLSQYSYCRLPILLPDIAPFTGRNGIGYTLGGRVDWREKVGTALGMVRSNDIRADILTWDDVARQTLAVAVDPDMERRLSGGQRPDKAVEGGPGIFGELVSKPTRKRRVSDVHHPEQPQGAEIDKGAG